MTENEEGTGEVFELLQKVNAIDQSYTGEQYIRELLRTVAEGVGVAYAFVGRSLEADPGKVITDHFWVDGQFVENVTYDLHGTPCMNVISGARSCCFRSGVANLFPDDQMLKDMSIESYIGAPTLKGDGELFGLVVLLDRKPMEHLSRYLFLAEFVAARVTAEYRRIEYEERLRRINEDLEKLAQARAEELKVALMRLLSQEKLATVGRITFGIAHELKNPLSIIINSADIIRELVESGESRSDIIEAARLVKDQGVRANAIISDMLKQARQDVGAVLEEVSLSRILDRSITMCVTSITDADFRSRLQVARDFDLGIRLKVLDPASLERVFINIFDNAIYALRDKSRLPDGGYKPRLRVSLKQINSNAEIVIEDNGTGISGEHLERIFDEFYTTKPAGEGTGLGLSIAKEVIGKNSGTLRVTSVPGGPTEVIITLPLAQ